MRRAIVTWAGAWALALVVGALPAGAEDKPAAPSDPSKTAPGKPPDKAKPIVIVGASSDEGFVLRSEDGAYKLQLKGLVQFDGRFFPGDSAEALTDSFVVRRARPILQGTVGRWFDFNLTPDFGVAAATLQDAYVDAKIDPAFGLRVGKQKPPIGLEHLQGDAYVAFLERSLPSALVPNRDVGAQVRGEAGRGVLSYAAGVFGGTPDGASLDLDTNDGKALVGRLVVAPLRAGRSALAGLSLGIGGSTEEQSGAAATLAGYRTGGQALFFVGYASGVGVAGRRTRIAPELSYFHGPVGLLAEWVRSQGRLARTTTTGGVSTASPTVTLANEAWQATLGVFVTGEPASFDGVKVRRPLDPAKGQWGAVQLAVRVNGFAADEDAFTLGWADPARSARKAFAWGVAVNWWLNRNLRQAVSYERTTFEGGAAQGGDRPAENALFIRTQLSF